MSNRRIDDEKLDEISGGVMPENTEIELSLNPEDRLSEKVDLQKELTARLKADIIKEAAPASLTDRMENEKFIKSRTTFLGSLLKKLKLKL